MSSGIIAFRLKPLDRPAPAVCGTVHPEVAAFAAVGVSMAPCHLPLGHLERRHCFDCESTDGRGTLRLRFAADAVEYAEHLQICDACSDEDGPGCPLGELKLATVMERGSEIQNRQRGW